MTWAVFKPASKHIAAGDSLPWGMADDTQTSQSANPMLPDGRGAHSSPTMAGSTAQTAGRREIFWQNVVREILSSLAATAATFSGRLSATAAGAATSPTPDHELFDGRMAVITKLGQRIPIADVFPVFACGIPTSCGPHNRMLAADVQCSVFQIRTPSGEVYTLPIHEIASIHALSESLVKKLEADAREQGQPDGEMVEPFGFAAFTSLANSENDPGAQEAESKKIIDDRDQSSQQP